MLVTMECHCDDRIMNMTMLSAYLPSTHIHDDNHSFFGDLYGSSEA